jgi:Ca2+-binding RTX toxin-like protein
MATITGTTGRDTLNGTVDGDLMFGFADNDLLYGFNGNDTINGDDGDDALYGGNGLDSLLGGFGNDFLSGGTENDQLFGGAGNDTLFGDAGDDALTGDGGNDLLVGGEGNDIYYADSGDTILEYFGGGSDAVYSDSSFTLSENLDIEVLSVTGSAVSSSVYFKGNALYNYITSGAGNDTLDGGAGDDNMSANNGNDILLGGANNDTLDGGLGINTLDGGSGNDFFILLGSNDVIVEAIGGGIDIIRVTSSYVLATGVEMEIVTPNDVFSLTGISVIGNEFNTEFYGTVSNDTINGGAGNDSLFGNLGNDILIGGAGFDELGGSAGNDSYYVDIVDKIFEFGGSGIDTIFAENSFTLLAGVEVEVLAVANAALTTGVSLGGNEFSNQLLAAAGSDYLDAGGGFDTIYGFGGNDTLQGGTGSDVLVGGIGNDIYYVDVAGDVLIELAGEGAETAFTTVTYTLASGAEVENLVAFNAASLVGLGLTGNGFNNNILGTAGGDTINGVTGADTLYGFGGNDVYYVDSSTDIVVEAAGAGSDTIFSAGSYTLAFTTEIEVIAAANAASTVAVTLVGNEFGNQILASAGADSLSGDAGNDTLYGFGGADTLNGGVGNDVLIGGAGNDIYYVDAASDFVTEVFGEGADVVYTSSSYTLGAGAYVEILASANAASTTGLALTGNSFNNQLLGGAGADTIDGGDSVDTMYGFGGNDIYYASSPADMVIEAIGGGSDTIFVLDSYTLAGTSEVEVLAFADAGSTLALTLDGNEFDNQILGNAGINYLTGNAGNDTIYGFGGSDTLTGGLGNDLLLGGASADTFVLGQAFAGTTFDTVGDYNVIDDNIWLSHSAFSGLSFGALAASAFTIGSGATTAAHRIIYNTANGDLLYDADGSGAGTASLFANIGTGLAMTAGEFLVV